MSDVVLLVIVALIIGEVWLFISYQDLKKEIEEIRRKYNLDIIKYPTPDKTMDKIIEENLRPEDLER